MFKAVHIGAIFLIEARFFSQPKNREGARERSVGDAELLRLCTLTLISINTVKTDRPRGELRLIASRHSTPVREVQTFPINHDRDDAVEVVYAPANIPNSINGATGCGRGSDPVAAPKSIIFTLTLVSRLTYVVPALGLHPYLSSQRRLTERGSSMERRAKS